MGNEEPLTQVVEDHRVRVARERRDRMRKRLLAAVVESFARPRHNGPPTVDDIVEAAGVVRGTFYKYFASIDEAVDAAGQELFSDMDSSSAQLLEESGDGLSRLTAGIELFLIRVIIDPFWSAFIARADHLGHDTALRRGAALDLARAHAEGRISIENVGAATTLVVGALTHAIHDLSHGVDDQRAYMEALTVMILCGLGVQPEEAKAIMRDRSIFIRGLGARPDHLVARSLALRAARPWGLGERPPAGVWVSSSPARRPSDARAAGIGRAFRQVARRGVAAGDHRAAGRRVRAAGRANDQIAIAGDAEGDAAGDRHRR